MYTLKVPILIAVLGLAASAFAQDQPPGQPEKTVTWEQYQKAIQRIEALENKASFTNQPEEDNADTQEQFDELTDRIDTLENTTNDLRIGTTDFLVTGFAAANYESREDNSSSFNANFNPVFLWKLSDRISFAGELEFELGQSSNSAAGGSDNTNVNLEFMDISFVVNDYLTLRAGKILTPLSNFKEHLHPSWINKLPDQPLFAGGGARLIPTSSLAFEARGAVPISDSSRIFYSLYVANGPKLVTSGGKAGQLNFSNFSDVNSNKSVGGHIGVYIIPELDISYAFNYADIGANDTIFEDTNALIHDFSINYVAENEKLGGRLAIRGEYVYSDGDTITLSSTTFDNTRSGGYAQIAYRPTLSDGFFKDVEGVVRYDWLDNPSDGAGVTKAYDEERLTVGVNYWMNPSTVFKVAYRFDNVDDPTGNLIEKDALLMQVAIGF